MKKEKTQIAVVGLGYVGLPLAILLRKKNYNVVGIIRNPKKANLISNGNCPFEDKTVSKELKKYPIKTYTEFSKVATSKIIIICVPTPVKKNNFPD